MTTQDRIQLLSTTPCRDLFTPYVANFGEATLAAWLTEQLGHQDALDSFHPRGNVYSRAIAPSTILHIMSGNTPHAAVQSIFRGLLLGSNNIVKLPSSGLPELVDLVRALPEELQTLITLRDQLDDAEMKCAQVVIAIGSDKTMDAIQSRIRPHQTFVPHGHKLSIGIVVAEPETAAALAAQDVSLHEQKGCLSLHTIYIKESTAGSGRDFAEALSVAMAQYSEQNPPPDPSLSLAGAIRNVRELARFFQANGKPTELRQSHDSLAWTVVYEEDPTLRPSCLGRCVYVKPLPADLSQLGAEAEHLSTVAVHPFSQQTATPFTELPAHRFCPMGQSQQPSLFWHHDGFAPLTGLVKWQDIE
ncbi:MAG: acyl-CoA reductase [Akkermansiaceae bacterium]